MKPIFKTITFGVIGIIVFYGCYLATDSITTSAIISYLTVLGSFLAYLSTHESAEPITRAANNADSHKSDSNKFAQDKHHAQSIKVDDLTKLPNGNYFSDILKKMISEATRHNKTLGIMILQIDSFKFICDSKDKETVNAILQELTTRFKSSLREEDHIAKLSDDEFIFLLNNVEKARNISIVAEKIIAKVKNPIYLGSESITLSASIGISLYPNDGDTIEDLIENSQRALHRAKLAGGSTFHFHTEEIHAETLEYIKLESALRKAIHNREIKLVYQPDFNLKTGKIAALQSYMRWEHPVIGLIKPDKFIQIAEESSLIMDLCEWAIREISQHLLLWQQKGYEIVPVNLKLTQKQLQHPELSKRLSSIMSEFKLDPNYLKLEVTEKIAMKNVEVSMAEFQKLKSLGTSIVIEHFGTGYTSIRHLGRFPIQGIRLDRSILNNVPSDTRSCEILNAMILLAHQLGLEVTTEGVEATEQLNYLTSINCDAASGYLLSYPLEADKIIHSLNYSEIQTKS